MYTPHWVDSSVTLAFGAITVPGPLPFIVSVPVYWPSDREES